MKTHRHTKHVSSLVAALALAIFLTTAVAATSPTKPTFKTIIKNFGIRLVAIKQTNDSSLRLLENVGWIDRLDLSNSKITDKGLSYLPADFSCSHLNLGNTNISSMGLKHLSSVEVVDVLDLRNTNIDDNAIKQINIKLSGKLAGLVLRGTKITNSGLKALSGSKKLNILGLSSTDIDTIPEDFSDKFPKLTALNVSHTHINEKSIQNLSGLSDLELLLLTDTPVGDRGASQLKHLKSINELYIVATRITDSGFLNIVRNLPSLRFIDTSFSDISNGAFARAVKINPKLRIERTYGPSPYNDTRD